MYQTKQKKLLIDFIKKNKLNQFSTNDIIESVCPDGRGKSTMYRLISNMVDDGTLIRMSGNDAKNVLYQYTGEGTECYEHFHLKCTLCGKLIHLNCEEISKIEKHIEENHGFYIDPVKTVFYGLCDNCQKVSKGM